MLVETNTGGANVRAPSTDHETLIPDFPSVPSVYHATYNLPPHWCAIAAPECGHPAIFHLSSATRTGSVKVSPPSREVEMTMSRMSPSKTFRHATNTSPSLPKAIVTRQ